MPWQFIRYSRRPFQSLFFAFELSYARSQELFIKIHAQDPSRPEDFDQNLWMEEKAFSRDCLIMGMAGIEALANNLYRDFATRSKNDLPDNLLNKNQRKNEIEWWRLTDKVYFLPTICNITLSPPASYFDKESDKYKLFEELIEIRNSILHGRPEALLMLAKLNPNKRHELIDNFDQNFWPCSKLPKDITAINGECAKIAYENIIWVRDSLVGFIEKLNEKYLKEERFTLISPVIPEQNADKNELMTNWRKYIDGRSYGHGGLQPDRTE